MAASSPAPGEDTSVALALVNTCHAGPNGPVDHLPTPVEAGAWLRARALLGNARPALKQHDLAQLAHLRASVRELFLACAEARRPDANAVDIVNEAAAGTPVAPSVCWTAHGLVRDWTTTRPGTFAEALARIAGDAIEVVCGERATTIRLCGAHGCVRVFFREHARRRWCSTSCGDRVRAARHYRLQQAQH